MIRRLAKETSPITTLPILYDSLVRMLYKGCHILRKVKNRSISRPRFKFMRVCGAVIKKRSEFAVFGFASLAVYEKLTVSGPGYCPVVRTYVRPKATILWTS